MSLFRKTAVAILIVIIGFLWLYFASLPKLVSVSFGGTLPDREIVDLVEQYDGEVEVAYGIISDLQAAYPYRKRFNIITELVANREATLSTMKKGLESATRIAGTLLSSSSDNFEVAARGVIHRYRVRLDAVRILSAGDPFFCGLEMRVPAKNLRRLEQDPRVKSVVKAKFMPITLKGPAFVVSQPECPRSNEFNASDFAGMDLRKELAKIAEPLEVAPDELRQSFTAEPALGNAPLFVRFNFEFEELGDYSLSFGDGQHATPDCAEFRQDTDACLRMEEITHVYSEKGKYIVEYIHPASWRGKTIDHAVITVL